MNLAVLCGNLADEPKSTVTSRGDARCTFRLAVPAGFTDQQGNKVAYFLNIVTWRKTAENCAKYLTKGRKVLVRGEIVTRSYEDRDGSRRVTTEIRADNVEFMPDGQGKARESTTSTGSASDEFALADDEELPF